MKIKVFVEQKEQRKYFDEDEQRMVEYEASNEIKGEFQDWELVEAFVNNVLIGFEKATIKIVIETEAE